MLWEQQCTRRLDREKGWKLEASPAAKGRMWARKGSEEREGRKWLGTEAWRSRWIQHRGEYTSMCQATMKDSGKTPCVKTIIGGRNPENSSCGNRTKEQCYREALSHQYLALNCFSALFCSPQITVKSADSVSCLLSILSPSKRGF